MVVCMENSSIIMLFKVIIADMEFAFSYILIICFFLIQIIKYHAFIWINTSMQHYEIKCFPSPFCFEVKVLVFLTMPVEPSSENVAQQIEYLWDLKAALTRNVAMAVIVSLLEDPLDHLER